MTDFNQQDVFLDVHFNKLNVAGQEFFDKEFDTCTFSGCNFSDVIFNKCKFYECKFEQCNLSMMNVKECSFFDVIFEECKIIGINWTKAAWPRIKLNSPFKFNKCILNNSSFFGLSLKEIVMCECKAKEVDFRESDCTEANFTYTDFAESLFGKTNLSAADFSEAINYNIDIFNNVIKKAKFTLPDAISLLKYLDIEIRD